MRKMRRVMIATALLAATPAVACECDDLATQSAADRSRQAKWIANMRPSIAEVELVRTELGERYRTVRHLLGEPQASYPVRDPLQPVTSCGYGIAPGKRAIMAFFPRRPLIDADASVPCGLALGAGNDVFPASMCTQFFIQAPGNLDLLRRSAVR